MPRYIDADKMVAKDNAYTTFPHDLAGCDDSDLVRWVNEQPTVDVVLKSEVAKIIAEIEKEIDKCHVAYYSDYFGEDGGASVYLETDIDRIISKFKVLYREGK